jgi:hypothetical protein
VRWTRRPEVALVFGIAALAVQGANSIMKFASDEKVRGIIPLIQALFRHVVWDGEPAFISDKATLLDVSDAPPEELAKRCSEYYRTPVSLDDLRRPLWDLLPELERRRKGSAG